MMEEEMEATKAAASSWSWAILAWWEEMNYWFRYAMGILNGAEPWLSGVTFISMVYNEREGDRESVWPGREIWLKYKTRKESSPLSLGLESEKWPSIL
jgi:hypothetical protein